MREHQGAAGPSDRDSGMRGIPLRLQAFRNSISGEEALKVGRRLIFLDEDGCVAVPMHPSLVELNLRSFMGRVKNIVMSSVNLFGKLIRSKVAPEVVRATGCYMDCSENFFVLNIASTKGKELRAEPELT